MRFSEGFYSSRFQAPYTVLSKLVLLLSFLVDPIFVAKGQSPQPDNFTYTAGRSLTCLAVQPDGEILAAGSYLPAMAIYSLDQIRRLHSDGTLDPYFVIDYDGVVQTLFVQPDGKILVAGQYSLQGTQPRTSLARFNADGSLDESFSPILTNPSESTPSILALALQKDGKILVSGSFQAVNGEERSALVRLSSDGMTDLSFKAQLNGAWSSFAQVNALAVQPDGKILVGGEFTYAGQGIREHLARLNIDGSFDLSFTNISPGWPNDVINALALQPDGKILVGGPQLTRLNADGTVDQSFSGVGFSQVEYIALQADGRILVARPLTPLKRFNNDGSIDLTFDPRVNPTYYAPVALQGDGKVLVATGTNLIRLQTTSPSGQILGYDNSVINWTQLGSAPEVSRTTFEFSDDGLNWNLLGEGTRLENSPSGVQSTWLLAANVTNWPNGTIRARGYTSGGSHGWGGFVQEIIGKAVIVTQPLSHSENAGATTTFRVIVEGTGPFQYQWRKAGLPLTNSGNISGVTNSVLTISDLVESDEGSYDVIVSQAESSISSQPATLTVTDPFILRQPMSYQRQPGQDATLTVELKGTPPFYYQWFQDGNALPGATNIALNLVNLQLTNAGLYYVIVSNQYAFSASQTAHLTVNAIDLDSSFFVPKNNDVNLYASQSDHRIVVAGSFSSIGDLPANHIARLNFDGTVDPSFQAKLAIGNGSLNHLILQQDGKIVLSGAFSGTNRILRVDQHGALDSAFNLQVTGFIDSLVPQSDGKFLAGGRFTAIRGVACSNLVRLNIDGTLDSTFNPRLVNPASTLALQADGRILAFGAFQKDALGYYLKTIIRLNPDGSMDSGFSAAGNLTTSENINSLVVCPDGKILIAGSFLGFSGQSRLQIARLNPDGTLDSSFNPGAGRNIYSLALQTDGSIIAAGAFTTFGGEPRNRLGRIHADGTPDLLFNPGSDYETHAIMLLQDGRILRDTFLNVSNGNTNTFIGRLNNTQPALEQLEVEADTITWRRDGSGPEVWCAFFEHSSDGILWTRLGDAVPIAKTDAQSGGWRLTGISVPQGGSIRARGYTSSGMYNSSHWLVEAHAGLPLILDEPVGSTNVAGTQVTFTVQAAGSEPLQYQWFHNGSPLSDGEGISGSTGPSLILGSTREVNQGDYQVTITNSFGAVTSVTVHHEVIDPAITLQPVSQNKEPGETATLSVTAAGTALTYQWLKDGAPLDGATASALTLTNLQGSDAGIYSVTITAPHASTNSAGALLTVNLTSTDIEFSQSALPVSAMVVQRDGKILVGDFRTERLNSDGTVDDQFAGFIDSYAYAFALRSDGEILAAGAFRHLNNLPQPDLGLLQADGTSDSSFRPTLDGTVRALLIQTNHQILVGGDFQKVSGQPRKGIARLNSDGSLDSQFQSLGASGLNDKFSILCLAEQLDGKILVGGSFNKLEGQGRSSVGRYNAEGTLDADFHPIVSPIINNADAPIRSILIQPDGRIVIGGEFLRVNDKEHRGIARLNIDGSLDESFAPNLASPSFPSGVVTSLALQADGRILVLGQFQTVSGALRQNVARLLPDGSLDLTFNLSAISENGSMLTLQKNGQILIAHVPFVSGVGRPRILRFNNSEPALDNLYRSDSTLIWNRAGTGPEISRATFEHSSDGRSWIEIGDGTRIADPAADGFPGWQLTGIALPNGGTFRARGSLNGTTGNGSHSFVESYSGSPVVLADPFSLTNDAEVTAVFRVVAAGSGPLSYQWFKDGVALTNGAGLLGVDTDLLTIVSPLRADEGNYMVTVSNSEGSFSSATVTLIIRDPLITLQPVTQFKNQGEEALLEVGAAGTALHYQWWKDGEPLATANNAALVLTNLQAINAGNYLTVISNSFATLTSSVVTLDIDCSTLDPSFAPPVSRALSALAGEPDGHVFLSGYANSASITNTEIRRLDTEGNVDTNFLLFASERVYSLLVQTNNGLILAGAFTNFNGSPRLRLARLNSEGQIDTDFKPAPNSDVLSMAQQVDGKLLIGGRFTNVSGLPRTYLARLSPRGEVDLDFAPVLNSMALALAVQSDGKILVSGGFSTVNGQARFRFARLSSDGEVDSVFNPGPNSDVTEILVQPDDKILIAGAFSYIGTEPRDRIARLYPDGTLDTQFVTSFSSFARLETLALQADGKVLIGGDLSSVSGLPRYNIARLQSTGALDLTFRPFFQDPSAVQALLLQDDGRIIVAGYTNVGSQLNGKIRAFYNTETPTQLLTYTNSTITWLRGGTSPELSFVTFEHSIDRTNWTFLGHGVRLFQESKSVGWQLTPPSPLFGGTIRARGYFINASSSLVESYFTFEQGPPQLVIKAMGGAFEFRWPASASAYILESSPSLSPTASWQVVPETAASSGRDNVLLLSPSDSMRFYRLRQ